MTPNTIRAVRAPIHEMFHASMWGRAVCQVHLGRARGDEVYRQIPASSIVRLWQYITVGDA